MHTAFNAERGYGIRCTWLQERRRVPVVATNVCASDLEFHVIREWMNHRRCFSISARAKFKLPKTSQIHSSHNSTMAPRRPRRLLQPSGGILAALSDNDNEKSTHTPPRTLIVSRDCNVAKNSDDNDESCGNEENDLSALSENSSSDEKDDQDAESEEESEEEGDSDVETEDDEESVVDEEDDESVEASFRGDRGKVELDVGLLFDGSSKDEEDFEEESDYEPEEEDDDSLLEADDAEDQEIRPARRNKMLLLDTEDKGGAASASEEESNTSSDQGNNGLEDCEFRAAEEEHDDDSVLVADAVANEDELFFATATSMQVDSEKPSQCDGSVDPLALDFGSSAVTNAQIRSPRKKNETVDDDNSNNNNLSTETGYLVVNDDNETAAFDDDTDHENAIVELPSMQEERDSVNDHSNTLVELGAGVVDSDSSVQLVKKQTESQSKNVVVLVTCDTDDSGDEEYDDDEIVAEIVDSDDDEEYNDDVKYSPQESCQVETQQVTKEDDTFVEGSDERMDTRKPDTEPLEKVMSFSVPGSGTKDSNKCSVSKDVGVDPASNAGNDSSCLSDMANATEFKSAVNDRENKDAEEGEWSVEPILSPCSRLSIRDDIYNAGVSAVCQNLNVLSLGQGKLTKSPPDGHARTVFKDGTRKDLRGVGDTSATATEMVVFDRLLNTSMDSHGSTKDEIIARGNAAVDRKLQADGCRYRREGSVKRGKWKLGAKIGSGAFGVVHVGMNTHTGTLMAVKSLKMEPAMMKDAEREIQLLKSLKHENIVRYYGAEMDSKYLHIFQEWVPAGSISEMLSRFGPFPIPVLRNYLSQILEGLKYLHGNRIMHRDVKGSNILVNDEGIVKLADFGASKRFAQLKGDLMMSLTMRGSK
jgi:Protein kinase domain